MSSIIPHARARPCRGGARIHAVRSSAPLEGTWKVPADTQPHGILTRGLSRVTHPDERVGAWANYIGRWINARGEAGPWSHPVRMVLAMPSGRVASSATSVEARRREAA